MPPASRPRSSICRSVYDWLFATTAAAWINGRCKPSEICIGDWRQCASAPRVSVHDSRCGAGEAPARRWKSRFRSKLRRRPAPDVGAERSFVGFRGSHRPFGTPDSNLLRSLASSTQRATFRSRQTFCVIARSQPHPTSSTVQSPIVLRPQRPPVVGEGDPAIIQSRKRNIFSRVFLIEDSRKWAGKR